MQIKPLNKDDLDEVIELYKCCFPKTLMSIMGNSIIRTFLEWCLQANHYFFVLSEKNKPVAFICGYYYRTGEPFIHSTSELSKYLRKEMFRTLMRKPWKLFHPIFVQRLARQVKHQIRKKEGKNDLSERSELALLSMGVHPNHKRKGYASKMVEFISEFALQKQISCLKLTVEAKNKTALHFFDTNGWSDHKKMPDYIIKYKYLTNA